MYQRAPCHSQFAVSSVVGACVLAVLGAPELLALDRQGWKRHVIDAPSAENQTRGADGVRLADVNGDGLMDIATGWEEGGTIRAYLNPGYSAVTQVWPAVTIGRVNSPEDAVFADLEGDGVFEVISACEGQTASIFIHWAPAEASEFLEANAWRTATVEATQRREQWMYVLPLDMDGRHGIDLLIGSKAWLQTQPDGTRRRVAGSVSWLECPARPREMSEWTLHHLYQAGWIMSLEPVDLDVDGDLDVVVSDRRGSGQGVLWLENPRRDVRESDAEWKVHRLGADGVEVMFLTVVDFDGDGRLDVVTATLENRLIFLHRQPGKPPRFAPHTIHLPAGYRRGKAVRAADLDLDGRLDLMVSTEEKAGVFWMRYRESVFDGHWRHHAVSGPEGAKFDLIQVLDLDGDGDEDAITCEERENLGVIWYENPAR